MRPGDPLRTRYLLLVNIVSASGLSGHFELIYVPYCRRLDQTTIIKISQVVSAQVREEEVPYSIYGSFVVEKYWAQERLTNCLMSAKEFIKLDSALKDR